MEVREGERYHNPFSGQVLDRDLRRSSHCAVWGVDESNCSRRISVELDAGF